MLLALVRRCLVYVLEIWLDLGKDLRKVRWRKGFVAVLRGCWLCFFFQAEDGIRDYKVTGVQTCALPISARRGRLRCRDWPGAAGHGPESPWPLAGPRPRPLPPAPVARACAAQALQCAGCPPGSGPWVNRDWRAPLRSCPGP